MSGYCVSMRVDGANCPFSWSQEAELRVEKSAAYLESYCVLLSASSDSRNLVNKIVFHFLCQFLTAVHGVPRTWEAVLCEPNTNSCFWPINGQLIKMFQVVVMHTALLTNNATNTSNGSSGLHSRYSNELWALALTLCCKSCPEEWKFSRFNVAHAADFRFCLFLLYFLSSKVFRHFILMDLC